MSTDKKMYKVKSPGGMKMIRVEMEDVRFFNYANPT